MPEKQVKSLHKDLVSVTNCCVLLNFTVKLLHIAVRGSRPNRWVQTAESTAAPELPQTPCPYISDGLVNGRSTSQAEKLKGNLDGNEYLTMDRSPFVMLFIPLKIIAILNGLYFTLKS